MGKARSKATLSNLHNPLLLRKRKSIPHEFVLDALAPLIPYTRSMFGCIAVYVKEKIVLILRDKKNKDADDGVWLATTEEHHNSLRRDFPNMRSIKALGKNTTGWQLLAIDAQDFEESAMHACQLIKAGDPRIGKVPGSKQVKKCPEAKKKGDIHARSRCLDETAAPEPIVQVWGR